MQSISIRVDMLVVSLVVKFGGIYSIAFLLKIKTKINNCLIKVFSFIQLMYLSYIEDDVYRSYNKF